MRQTDETMMYGDATDRRLDALVVGIFTGLGILAGGGLLIAIVIRLVEGTV